MTTNVEWLDAIQALAPTGVKKRYAQRPDSLTTADLPAAWPMLPGVERGAPIATCADLSKTRTIGYQVAYQPVAQDKAKVNLEALAVFVDRLETAFDGLMNPTSGVMEFIEYTIDTTAEINVAGVNYFGLECTITGRNAQ